MVSNIAPESGCFLTPLDVEYKKQVAVIGGRCSRIFVRTVNPLDRKIKLDRFSYRIIGVTEEQGGGIFGGPNFDRRIYSRLHLDEAFGGCGRQAHVDIAIKAPARKNLAISTSR